MRYCRSKFEEMATTKKNPRISIDPKGHTYAIWYDSAGKRRRNRKPQNVPPEKAQEWANSLPHRESAGNKPALELREALKIRASKPRFGIEAQNIYLAAIRRFEAAGQNIDRMTEQMKLDGLKPTTVSHYVSALAAIHRKAAEYGLLERRPECEIKPPRPDSQRRKAPSREERDRIMAYLKKTDPELYLFASLVHYAFIRSTEILRLKPDDYDFNAKTITVRAEASKTGYAGTVFMVKAFQDVLGGKVPVFQSDKPDLYARRFKKAVQALGMNYTLYTLKHTGVSLLIDAGVSLTEIRDQCRHRNIGQTDRYCQSLGRVSPTLVNAMG